MQLRNKKKSSKKPVIIAIIAVIVFAAICAGVYFWQNKNSNQQKNQVESTQHTDKKSDAQKQSLSTDTDASKSTDSSSTHEKEKNITPPYEGDDANASQTLTGTINYSEVVDNSLIIRTTINQMLDSGTCQLTLTNGSSTVTKTSDIAQNPSSSTCKGFDIPTSELSSGNWNITIKINGANRTGTLTGSAKV